MGAQTNGTTEQSSALRRAPVLIGDVVAADVAELREIASWFDARNSSGGNGKFLRDVANRHELLFATYSKSLEREQTVLASGPGAAGELA